ncbi:DUF1766-domain-containing protein [Wallemia mellicola]|uniref:DUF1766-domain-containing protein n=1 Tax=Wallemia mellicola TaxID=1708541 RepID=A0A4T0PVP9_9BASI|nr:DUF1766-domain-containing protein [Wallemia mellicola]TIB93480.1 DUF1766-domain-containing protein [Wallemia mellicola]TIB97640.1 DUF1766-domain-containing protein [Wallemia mellicola]TIC01531.1 DUF1766-domain-containing protein [Wallemia mellicola]TIC07785.1 DUF1766-domain-containing protein [Wallemia mellicola]
MNSETLPRFCHQHSKDILAQKGYYNTRGDWIAFEDWIPRHLSSYTQIQLRVLMEKPISATDAPGYIYVYTLSGSTTVTHVEYKIGRTNNINRRLDSWSKQCNRELVLRQHFPTSVAPSSRLLTTFAVDPKIQCVYVNRLESEWMSKTVE